MKEHIYPLYEVPFEMINNGEKTIEYRLNDEKRQELRIGDIIVFNKINSEESIRVIVLDLKYFPDLFSMYSATFENYLKDYYNNVQEVVNDTPYYTDEEVKKYGCVAIYFKKI